MLLRLLCCFNLLWLAPAAFADDARIEPVKAELIAETSALVPGDTPNWVALKLTPLPDWHVYWRNWGDSGIATKLEWKLPAGVQAGDIVWPIPHTYRLGDLANYGYGETTLHLVPIRIAAGTQGPVRLAATAKWLACKDVCIPGSAQLELTLPVAASSSADPAQRAAFAKARAQWPQAVDWPAQFAIADDTVSIAVQDASLASAERISFYPYSPDLVNHAAEQRIALDGKGLRLSQAQSTYFSRAPASLDGVLVLEQGAQRRGYEIHATPGSVAAVPVSRNTGSAVGAPPRLASATTADAAAPRSLLAILGFALIGGLILNLMPCVFPVLSLKALSMLRAGAEGQRAQALVYSLGVVVSCVAAAGIMLALRGAGSAVGWGFQLQSPVFVGALAYLLFALGLSLSGVAEFGGRLMNVGQRLTERGGLGGAFFTGVLAVIVASPCSAPLMGTALGYAMTQTAAIALLIFATLGLGLALPFLVLAAVPAAAKLLPKPGAWMLRFKQAMAFPLYLSVVWLLWVLARQLDATAAAQLAIGLVLVAFVLWLWSAHGLFASLAKLAAAAGAIALLLTLAQPPREVRAEAWSTQRVAELRAEGRTIFVDFTADWCLSCKVNERVALNSGTVQQAFRDRDVAVLVADWTRSDPAITAELERFGRSGVPLYLVYRAGGEPVILPQLLTPALVVDAID